MIKYAKCAKACASALGLAWAASSSAQSLPSPVAPTTIARPAQTRYAPTPQASSGGVINAERVFNQAQQQRVKPVVYEHGYSSSGYSSSGSYTSGGYSGYTCSYDCNCPNCMRERCANGGYSCEMFQCAADGDIVGMFWNPDGEGFTLWDAIAAQTGYEPCIGIGGWYQTGYHNQNNTLGFNRHEDSYNLHQAWLYFEKVADGSEGFDWGFRADVMYGVDGADTQAFGNNPGAYDFMNGFDHGRYAWALPQMYAEVAMGDLSVKVGHFFTTIGYEVVPAPDNFFYSHAFTMYNSEPFTHTGALATYSAGDNVTLYGGYVLGWDTGFDRRSDGSSFLGGFSVNMGEDVTFTYMSIYGDFGARSADAFGTLADYDNGYMQSIVLDMQLTDKLEYVFQTDYLSNRINLDATAGGPARVDDYAVGVNQYLFYNINDWLAAGVRGEWWRARPVFAGTAAGNIDPVSMYEVTTGLNVKPNPNLTIRPEIRYQWSPRLNSVQPGLWDEWILGVDAVWTF
jgi:hypothetical protein